MSATGAGSPDGDHGSLHFRVVERGELTDADVARMLELLALGFDHWPPVAPGVDPADYLRWKTSSPNAICAAVLGEDGDELVTTDICTGYALRLGGRRALRAQFVDHVVRPTWRGRGVSSASLAFRQRTVAARYEISISDAQSKVMIHRAVRFGTRPFGNPIHPLVLPLEPRAAAAAWAQRQGLPPWTASPVGVLLAARSALRRRRGRVLAGKGPELIPIERFDQRIDTLFAAAAPAWDLIVERTREHLDWRYCDPRGGAFLRRAALDRDRAVLGYAVAARRDRRAYLADLLALPGREDVVAPLLGALVPELARAGCSEMVCWLPRRHPYRAAFARSGFLDAREAPTITFRPSRGDGSDLDFLTAPDLRLHFTLGDTDLV